MLCGSVVIWNHDIHIHRSLPELIKCISLDDHNHNVTNVSWMAKHNVQSVPFLTSQVL